MSKSSNSFNTDLLFLFNTKFKVLVCCLLDDNESDESESVDDVRSDDEDVDECFDLKDVLVALYLRKKKMK